jgi:DNA (cytosine-5)-methyltransferase 1
MSLVVAKIRESGIVDIGMRMLTPRELATAQGFPASYILTGSKRNQVARIGNSVSPYPAAALLRVNFEMYEPLLLAA